MGTTQSRQRDSCTQTSPFECRKVIIEVPVGSCSTLHNMPVRAGPPATIKIALDARTTQPPRKRRKCDPNSSPLKSQRDDKSICSQHILLHRKANNAALQIMADAVVGQYTFKGFPSNKILGRRMRSKKVVKRQDSSKGFEMNVQNSSTLPIFKFKLNKKVEFVDSVASTSLCNKETLTESESQRNEKVTFDDSVVPSVSILRNSNLTEFESEDKENMTIADPIAPEPSARSKSTQTESESKQNKKVNSVARGPLICINSTLTGSENQPNKEVIFVYSVAPPSTSILKNSNLTGFESQGTENMTTADPTAPVPSLCSKSTQTESESKQNKKVNSIARGPLICINSTLAGSESQRNKEVTFVDSLAPAKSIIRNSNLTELEMQERENMTIVDPIAPEPSLRSKSTESESKRIKKVIFFDSVVPSASIQRNSNLTECEGQVKTEYEDKSICTQHTTLSRKKDNGALQIIAYAVVGQHTVKGFSNKVLKKRMPSKKTVTCQDSSDDFEIDIKRNKKVSFMDSVAPSASILRNSNFTKCECRQNKKVAFKNSVRPSPSILRNSTSTKSESQQNKNVAFVDSLGPALLTRSHSTLSKSVNNRNQKVLFENSTAPANSIRKNWTLPKYEIQPKKKVTFADSVASAPPIRSRSTFTKSEIQPKKKVTFADSVASAPPIRSRSTFTKSENSRTKMVSFADSIAPVKFILTNSPLSKCGSQRNKRVTRADTVPLNDKDDTTENCLHDTRNYYDLNISNEKLFTDTEENGGKKLNPCEKRFSQLNYNSDSSGHSIPTVKLSYEMRKIYYYL